ncbi:ANTAR domain-containing response regulator [Pelotomaculum propionicicum]|uniref:ANTAR domain-containing response regulator n=1 Tax=Pelotomaculum propionicicum TaxID=258475 RepID=UPI003B76E060
MFGTRIVIADADAGYRKKIKEMLVQAGYLVTGEVGDSRSVLKVISRTEPDLVIMDPKLPGAHGMDIIKIIEEHRAAPVILLTESHEQGLPEEVKGIMVFGCLPKTLSDVQLLNAVELAIYNFRKYIKLMEENKRLKKALEERKLVEKAKGLLIQAKGLSEGEAYKYLQKLSMDNCIPIAVVASRIITQLRKK